MVDMSPQKILAFEFPSCKHAKSLQLLLIYICWTSKEMKQVFKIVYFLKKIIFKIFSLIVCKHDYCMAHSIKLKSHIKNLCGKHMNFKLIHFAWIAHGLAFPVQHLHLVIAKLTKRTARKKNTNKNNRQYWISDYIDFRTPMKFCSSFAWTCHWHYAV